MKLNYNSTKNTRSLLKLLSVLCLVAFTFCANSDTLRRTNKKTSASALAIRSKTKIPDEFEAYLKITNKDKIVEEYTVKLKKDFLSTPLSGFKFEMTDKNQIIKSPSVTLSPNEGYFVSYQLFTNKVDCTNSGWFSNNSMTYFLADAKDNYSLQFTFKKKNLFWDVVKNDELHALCMKIAGNYYNYKSGLSQKITDVTNALSAARNLEDDKSKNMKTREDFELAAKGKADVKKILVDQLNALNVKKREYIEEIKNIEESKTTKQKDYDNLGKDIQKQEQVITNINSIIDEKSKSSTEIKLVTDKDINERYDAVKAALQDYIKLYLPKDPFVVNTLSPMLADVRVSKNNIIPALRMN